MELARLFALSPEQRLRRTEALVEAVRSALEDEAPSEAYRKAITARVDGDVAAEVVLGVPGSYLERGQPPRDMRELVLRSPKAKLGRHGQRYLAVPMRGGFRTASDSGRPWMSHGHPGAARIPKVLDRMEQLLVDAREAAR